MQDSEQTGVGALRQCDLADGKNYIRERIIGYEPQRKLVIDIYEGSLPLKSAVAMFTFRAINLQKTEQTMQMEFQPKFGLLGKLMIPMMKPQFRRMLQALLDANAEYVVHGRTVAQAA